MAKRQYDDDELHWYALDVVRQKEYVAGYLLNKMGAMTFIPTSTRFRKKNRYSKGKMEVAHATISGTIFVGFPTAPVWYRVMSMHLVNGVLSVDGRPRRIDTASRGWLEYRGRQLDGQLTLERHLVLHKGQEVERSAALISVQGRGVLRTHTNLKLKAAKDRPLVIRAAGERARILGTMLEDGKADIADAA
ncbi:MAG TPA: transcription termination/antitermination NusG family protein [Devosia sp.]|jgi:hypothetical protein|nr:transcription termination/antitermination NusG family protein [Devosia sp.]